jgi:hypothetical protein
MRPTLGSPGLDPIAHAWPSTLSLKILFMIIKEIRIFFIISCNNENYYIGHFVVTGVPRDKNTYSLDLCILFIILVLVSETRVAMSSY